MEAPADGFPSPAAGLLGKGAKQALTMTLLDWGLAEELTPRVRHHFISFLHCISSGGVIVLMLGSDIAPHDIH